MRKLIYILTALTLTISCRGQVVQEKEVRGFSSGLVNSLPDELIPDDAAIILENFDVTSEGFLKRRRGMSAYFPQEPSDPYSAVIPYYQYNKKALLFLRLFATRGPANPSYYKITEADTNVAILTTQDFANEQCSVFVYGGFYWPYRDPAYPFNFSAVTMNNNIAIAGTNSEMVIYDGSNAFPARPLGPGQARVAVMNGGGNVKGLVSYKYCYLDNDAGDTSNFSAPTWTVQVNDGKVFIYGFTVSDEAAVDSILIFRSLNSGNYEQLANVANSSSATYFDNILATSAADTFAYPAGPDGHCVMHHDSLCGGERLIPPGGMSFSVDTCVTANYGAGLVRSHVSACTKASYSIVYIDSAGRRSYIGPGTCIIINDTTNWKQKVTLTNIPVSNSEAITKKLLLKGFADNFVFKKPISGTAGPNGDVYILDTLDPEETTFVDSISYDTLSGSGNYDLFCVYPYSYYSGDISDKDSSDLYLAWMETPTNVCYDDSVISFQPTDITIHGDRVFAIGDMDNRNRLWYSDFGRPTTWPWDKYINVGSSDGDWLVRAIPEQNSLILFRQNSIYQLSGFNFFQFTLNKISSGVGLVGPQAVGVSSNNLMFLSSKGVYDLGTAVSDPFAAPLSTPIENSLDSAKSRFGRAWAGIIDDEFWLSLAIDSEENNKTYVFSQTPRPHWKEYSFGIVDGGIYDVDTSYINYDPDRWVLALSNDTLWRWGYSDDDTLDGEALISAKYQSKFFFGDLNREKIYYVDIIGKGLCDSLRFIFYNKIGDSATGEIITPVDTIITHVNFYSQDRQRIKVDRIFNSFSVKIEDFGTGDYELKGFVVGYQPWDTGRKRP